MSVSGALRARRSCRSFSSRPLEQELVDDLVDRARRTPTAGNSQGVEFLVLDRPEAVTTYWNTSLSDEARSSFAFPGLLRAPLLVVPFGLPGRYLDRYSEPDKVMRGMGNGKECWSVPYWLVDAAFAAMALQLLAVELGLGCCFFGLFAQETSIRERFGIPDEARAVGTVAIGHPEPIAERPGHSARRARRPLEEVVHRGYW